MASKPDHQTALEAYRAQLAEIERQISDLQRQRHAMSFVVQGLEVLANDAVKPVFHSLSFTTTAQERQAVTSPTTPSPPPDGLSTLGLAVRAVRQVDQKMPRGAKEIQRLIAKHLGAAVNYQTLYKSLRRDAKRPEGLFYQRSDLFGLREWLAVQLTKEQ